MKYSQLYQKLAVERCRLYVAQLCAANHLQGTEVCFEAFADARADEPAGVDGLLKLLDQDLQVLDASIHED